MKFYRPISGQITRLNKLNKLKIVRHVECMRRIVHSGNNLFPNLEGKKDRCRWNDNNEIHPKVMRFENVTVFF
jgi:hypothetical protein